MLCCAVLCCAVLSDAMLQAMEVRIAAAHAVAHQWFGVLMRPRTPADAWLVEGLAGYLTDLFVRRFLGKNELRFRSESSQACCAEVSRHYTVRLAQGVLDLAPSAAESFLMPSRQEDVVICGRKTQA